MLRTSPSRPLGETETCVHCESEDIVKRGTTGKDAQQYWCKECETYFNDLANTIFGQHRFGLEEVFYIGKGMRPETTAQIARDVGQDMGRVSGSFRTKPTLAATK